MTFLAAMPLARASFVAVSIIGASASAEISLPAGTGFTTSWPPGKPRAARPWRWAARDLGGRCPFRSGAARPEDRDQKAGTSSCPKAMTGTPRVSSRSRVFGCRESPFGPAADHRHRRLGQFGESRRKCRSSSPRPGDRRPIPPVAKTAIPGQPGPRSSSRRRLVARNARWARAAARSPLESFASPGPRGEAPKLVGFEADPKNGRPITAIVAGTALPARMSASQANAVSTFSGAGIPWVMIVDSRRRRGDRRHARREPRRCRRLAGS